MSRSYKKNPVICVGGCREAKKWSNKRIRRFLKDPEVVLNYRSFRKVLDSWEIKDYKEFAKSFEQFYLDSVHYYNLYKECLPAAKAHPPTREEAWRQYLCWYVRK